MDTGRIAELQDRLNITVDYAKMLRASDDAFACEKAIRYANMLSHAIVALSIEGK